MKMPWTDRTGTAKAAAIFATGLGISTGLWGQNVVAVLGSRGDGSFLLATGWIELAGMIVSAAGLIVVMFVFLFPEVREFMADRKPYNDTDESGGLK